MPASAARSRAAGGGPSWRAGGEHGEREQPGDGDALGQRPGAAVRADRADDAVQVQQRVPAERVPQQRRQVVEVAEQVALLRRGADRYLLGGGEDRVAVRHEVGVRRERPRRSRRPRPAARSRPCRRRGARRGRAPATRSRRRRARAPASAPSAGRAAGRARRGTARSRRRAGAARVADPQRLGDGERGDRERARVGREHRALGKRGRHQHDEREQPLPARRQRDRARVTLAAHAAPAASRAAMTVPTTEAPVSRPIQNTSVCGR